jgi:hypothetical protein
MNSSGFAIESIYFFTLCSEKYVGKTIKELPLFHDSPDLPEWTKDFVWNVEMKSIVNFDDLIYFENIQEMKERLSNFQRIFMEISLFYGNQLNQNFIISIYHQNSTDPQSH